MAPDTSKRTFGERVLLYAEIAGAVLVLNTGLNALEANQKSIDRQTVYAFWHDYYLPTAQKDPERALRELTTDGFKQLDVGDPGPYKEFWSRVESTPELTVTEELPGPPKNKFDVHWRFNYNDNTKSGTVTIRTHVVCASRAARYIPFWDCKPSDVRLDDDQKVKG